MTDLSLIEDNYKRISTDELINIAKEPELLELEVIPLLQKELFSRNKQEEALALSNFLINGSSERELTKRELKEQAYERIESGESIDSIRLDLKDKGVDMFDVVYDSNKRTAKILKYLMALKEQDLGETEINEKLQKEFSMTEAEADIVQGDLKAKGRQNQVIGATITLFSGVIVIASIALGGSVGIGGVLLLGLGVWRIAEGAKQRR
jgi:hypothetical protein